MMIQHEQVVRIDLEKLQANVRHIGLMTSRPVIAVVKANAYGCGIERVSQAIAGLVEAYYVFYASESTKAQLWQNAHRPTIALHGDVDIETMRANRIRPCVWSVEQAREFASLDPVLIIDTGQQRFGCKLEEIESIVRIGQCRETMTHATTLEQVQKLQASTKGMNLVRHAAGSGLLHAPEAWCDAVRPGMAMYDGAVRISSRLIECKPSNQPAGYGGFVTPHLGVIPVGYSNGLRPGPCIVNGRETRILECGMQSSFIQTTPGDKVGDEVVLLGGGLTCAHISQSWKTSPQEVLLSLTRVAQVRI